MNQLTNDFRKCKWIIRKRYGLILTTSLVAVIIALLIGFSTPHTYEAVTSLRIKQSQELPLLSMSGGSPLNIKQTMANYAAMLKSRTVIQTAINLIYADKEFPPRYEQVLQNITVQPAKEADILYITVQASSPDEAQLLANTLSETLVSLLADEQSVVREFIGQRLKESKQELEQAEGLLERYKRDQKIVGSDIQSKAMAEKISALDKMIAENTVNLVTAQAKLSSAERQLAGQKPSFVADNPLIQQYKAKLADLEVELVGLLPQYADTHPKVVSLRAAITETRSKLNAEVDRVLSAESASGNTIHQTLLQGKMMAEADVAAASAQKRAIGNIQANSEKDLAALPAKEQGITRLLRDVQVAQEIYIMLDKRYEEARINAVMQPRDVKVLDAAIAPDSPVKSRKVQYVLIGAVLGLLAGVGLAFLLEYTNGPILNEQEAKLHLGLPVLGVIPDFELDLNYRREPFWSRIRNFSFNDRHRLRQ